MRTILAFLPAAMIAISPLSVVFAQQKAATQPVEQQHAVQPTSPARPSPMFDPRIVNEQLSATLAVLEFKKKETEALAYDLAAVQAKAAEDLKKLDEIWRKEFDGWCAGRVACGLQPKAAEASSNDKPAGN